MLWGHDLGWWGFWVGIAAIVLTVPLSMLGNILTPKIQNWWAERSAASTQKRIVVLEKQLSNYEALYKELNDTEDWILRGIEALGMLGSMILLFTSLCILALGTVYKPPQSILWRFPIPFEYMAVLAELITLYFMYGIFLKLVSYRRRRSPVTRRAMKLSIERLKNSIKPDAANKNAT